VAHLIPQAVSSCFEVYSVECLPIPVAHGAVTTYGYRIGVLGYVPDVKQMPASSLDLLQGVEVLIIDGLSFNPRHPTHLSVGEAVEISDRLGPRQTYLTHIMHRLDHRTFPEQCAEQGIDLPDNVALAYDGQVVEI
jgi:phosphoribosyl 1,2-cyclic phosphate phosphodiesterase